MITLHQPPPAWGLPSISPFCIKLETYLRMTKMEYKARGADIRVAPNGRVPYVEIDGKIMGDSTLIIDELKKRFGDPLDGSLTKQQRAEALLLQATVESHLYFANAYLRFMDDGSWKYLRDYFAALFPPVLKTLVPKIIRKDMRKILRTQGVGEHNRDTIVELAKRDLQAFSDYLGDKEYFLGSQPTSIDATMYGFLVQVLWIPWDNEIKQAASNHTNLIQFCERMKKKYWQTT